MPVKAALQENFVPVKNDINIKLTIKKTNDFNTFIIYFNKWLLLWSLLRLYMTDILTCFTVITAILDRQLIFKSWEKIAYLYIKNHGKTWKQNEIEFHMLSHIFLFFLLLLNITTITVKWSIIELLIFLLRFPANCKQDKL